MSKKKLKVQSSNEKLMDSLVAGIKRIAPKRKSDGTAPVGTIEVSRTSKNVLSKIRYVLKTGIEPFDRATGCVPFGRVTEIYGLESCGKTGMALRCAIRAQMREIYEKIRDPDDPSKIVLQQIPEDSDVTVVYVDNEQSIDEDQKTVIDGVALNAVLLRCDTVDQLFKAIDYCIDAIAEHERETGRQQFVVVIVDTIAGTASKEEMAQEWGKEDYSRQPKQLRQAFRRMTRKINRQNVAMICTNQVSERYQVALSRSRGRSTLPQDSDFDTFGGRALKYYSTLRVFMFRISSWSLVRGSKFPDGMLVGFCTSKNRQVKPLRSGRMVLIFSNNSEFDEEQESKFGGIIERGGGAKELQGGFNNIFSILEQLIFLGFASVSDTGAISFKFDAWGVPTKTFDGLSSHLEDDFKAERPGYKKRNPSIESKVDWPEFYLAHEADFRALWERAVAYMFENEGLVEFEKRDDDDEAADNDDELVNE